MRVHLAVEPSCLDLLKLQACIGSDEDVITIVVGGGRVRHMLFLSGFTPTRLISPPLGSRYLGYPLLRKLPQTWIKPTQLVAWSEMSHAWAEWLWPNSKIERGHELVPELCVHEQLQKEMGNEERMTLRQSWLDDEADEVRDGDVLVGLLTDHPVETSPAGPALGLGICWEILGLTHENRPRLVVEGDMPRRSQLASVWSDGTLPRVLEQVPGFAWPWSCLSGLDMAYVPASCQHAAEICQLARMAGLPTVLEASSTLEGNTGEQVVVVAPGDPQSLTEALLRLWPKQIAKVEVTSRLAADEGRD